MDLNTIKATLGALAPCDDDMRHYSVFLPLIEMNGAVHLLYEVRSPDLKQQPNEICFPGGRVECHETYDSAAIRETCEELGVSQESLEILGELQPVTTPFNMTLHVFAGAMHIEDPDILEINTDEVARIFTVPLQWLMDNDPEDHSIETRFDIPENFPYHKIQNGESYPWKKGRYSVLFYTYGEHVIWGMTARITHDFIKRLKKIERPEDM